MNRNKTKPIGVGTKVMLVGITITAAISFFSKPDSPDKIYFEPDKSGKLRQVDRAIPVVASSGPLWKPEPQSLLSHTKKLMLTEHQQKELNVIANDWVKEKSSLESQMATAASAVADRSRSKMSLGAINGSLSGYSEVSRTYNATRNEYWTSAIALLTMEQRALLESTLQTERQASR